MAAANPNESASNNSALIGGIVGGVGGLLLIVALIVGIFLYKRHKNLKKFEIFKKMEPATSQVFFFFFFFLSSDPNQNKIKIK